MMSDIKFDCDKMFCVILIFFYLNSSTADNGPLIETSLGKIKGFYRTSFEGRVYSAFEGIPYARPPIGNLRFKEPQPASPWSGILIANTRYVCKQVENPFMNIGKDTEDCLYLNVYTPKTEPSEHDNYDVIVNIHGGGFMLGTSSMAGPSYLMDRDIVYVNMNYRLGALGFLSTEDHVVAGNNGLKDQQLALVWVQSHIKQFGGNPKSVTLMGLSAGGASVHFHYFSPLSKGLFHRGISQSGTALMPWTMQENALQKTQKLAEALHCQNSDIRLLIDCLKSVSADDLVKETKDFYDISQLPLAPFAPVVEVNSKSAFLTKHPYVQLQNGEMYDAPWMTWISRDEGLLGLIFVHSFLEEVENNWVKLSEHFFDYRYVCPEAQKREVAKKIKKFYYNDGKICEQNTKPLVKAFGDRLFNVDFEKAVKMQAKAANSHVYAAIYGYNKSTAMSKFMGVELEGVTHGAEGILLHEMAFSSEQFKLSESDILVKNVLIDFITSFSSHGTPESSNVRWDPFSTTNPKYLLINDFNETIMGNVDNLSSKDFWDDLGFIEHDKAKYIREEL